MKKLADFIRKLKSLPNFEAVALASLAIFALVTAAWFPLLFSADRWGGDLDVTRRFVIYGAYAKGETDRYILSKVQPDELLKRQISLCERKYKLLLADFVPDALLKTAADPGSYFGLTVEGGDAVTVWHVKESWTADWENRAELYMDAETGEVYSFVYEGRCVANFEAYMDVDTPQNLGQAATRLEKIIEHPLQEGLGATRTYGTGDDQIQYRFQISYQNAEAARVQINALPPVEEKAE